MSKSTIAVNGALYDAETGKPVVAKPIKPHQTSPSPHVIRKFANRPKPAAKKVITDIGPARHPAVAKAHAARAATKAPRVLKSAQTLKQEAVAAAMEQSGKTSRKQHLAKKQVSKRAHTLHVAAIGLVVLLLGAYITYLSMPAISTRVAATQAGIDATFPSYQPTGYRLAAPVAYDNGLVIIKFAANAGPQSFTITEQRSTWDSTAVLENFVVPKVGKDYTVIQANGLTIYTYGQAASWVNGGILYTISGNAPLTTEQIQRIAVSM